MKKKPPIIILAGGRATRLRPLTKNIPKSMVLIDRRPFLDYQINQLKKFNFEKIIISTGFKSKIIDNYIKNKISNTPIITIKDNKPGIGTGGAIKNCLKIIKKNFFVIYGDSYLNLNINKVYKEFLKKRKNLLITAYKNNNKYDKSNLVIKKNKLILYDKKSMKAKHIDYGFLCFNKNIFKKINNKKFDLKKIITNQIKKNDISFYLAKKRFYEIGKKNSLNDFKIYAKKNKI